MNEKFEQYLEIELAGFPKQKRNRLHLELLQDLAAEKLNFKDISDFLNETNLKNVVIRQPFFENVLLPVLQEEVSQNNLRAIKYLIKLEQNLIKFQIQTKNYELGKRQLIIHGLEISPEDKELLEIYEKDLTNFLRYTIHEIPHGVLYGINGANETECDELIELLNDYKSVCGKLSLDRNDLIEQCEFHFRRYKIYLQKTAKFRSYEDFLNGA